MHVLKKVQTRFLADIKSRHILFLQIGHRRLNHVIDKNLERLLLIFSKRRFCNGCLDFLQIIFEHCVRIQKQASQRF